MLDAGAILAAFVALGGERETADRRLLRPLEFDLILKLKTNRGQLDSAFAFYVYP